MIDYVKIDSRIRIQSAAELLKCDKIVYVNKFNEAAVKQFREEFLAAHETEQEIIPIIIDSLGGEVYSVLAMADMIKASDRKIATVVIGKAMSCGAVLLTCGDEGMRYATPTSTIMIHDVSMMTWGKMEEIKSDAKEGERLNKLIFSMMEKNCGLEKGELLDKLRKDYNSADWFLTPQQAKKINIINHIKLPKLITEVTVKSELK